MTPTDRAICEKLRIKRHDNLPFTGWAGNRQDLANLYSELGLNKGVMVGIWDAVTAELFCQANKDIDLLCVDPWEAFGGHSQQKLDRLCEISREKLAPFKATVVRKKSIEVAGYITDKSLDFVYINGHHEFNPAMLDILYWAPKVKVGGIVSGHGFCNHYQGGVIYAVEAYARGNNINPWYLAHRDLDRQNSWLWVGR
jgi:hypothetical protein